jgi:NitT/TauT family transport system permease protein
VLGLAIVVVAWQLWATAAHSLLIPDAVSTVQAVGRLVFEGTIWGPLWLSNQAMVVGYVLAVLTAVPLGLLIARVRSLEAFLDVYLNILITTPMAALIPIFMMAFGLDLPSRAAVVYVFAAPIMVVNTRAGVRSVDPHLIEMARTFRASEVQVWRKVLLPGALPATMTGLRLGLSRALNGMLLAELLLMAVGVGRLILDYRGSLEPASLFGVVVILLVESVALLAASEWVERRAAPWASLGGER